MLGKRSGTLGRECWVVIEALVLAETVSSGSVIAAFVLTLTGLVCFIQGAVAYREPLPRFVLTYRGWSCPALAMLYLGVFLIATTAGAIRVFPPGVLGIVFFLAWLFCGVVFLLGFFVWFPWFLLPRWYRRARKAGVSRHDMEAMAAFKALPVEQQRRAAKERRNPN